LLVFILPAKGGKREHLMKRFAVIGAGAGGLCAAKHLLSRGIEVAIFEVGSKVGGIWVYENDSGLSPAYRSLHINSEAKVSSFVDFPFPPDCSLFPGHAEMARYFHDYAARHDLIRRISFNSRVVAIQPEEGRYKVRLESGAVELFDGVVAAAGHQSAPRHPPEMKNFEGEYLHSHAYRIPEVFSGKRVLVIGAGNSGLDIAADICTVTKATVLSARSPVLIMPRMMFGVPSARVLARVEKPFLPWQVRVWLRTMLTRVFHGRMEQWGFRTPKIRTHPASHPILFQQIAWNRIKVRPGISRIEGKQVHFADGTSSEFDSIIAATGYMTALPFLPESASPLSGTRLDLYNRVVHPSLPGVYFIGYFDITGGSNIRLMDDQADYIAAIASGAINLPSKDEMEKAIAADHAWQAKQFPDSPRYGLELDPRRYRKALAREYARNNARRLASPVAERALPKESGGESNKRHVHA
jgi:hypothetical protein